jgi:hypothetical protein
LGVANFWWNVLAEIYGNLILFSPFRYAQNSVPYQKLEKDNWHEAMHERIYEMLD